MSVPKPCCSACNAAGRHQCMQSSGGLQVEWRVSTVFPGSPALPEDWTAWEGGGGVGGGFLCTCSDTAQINSSVIVSCTASSSRESL